MATTYTKIASTTVGSGGTSQIEFTSIPGTYTDLLIKLSARFTTGDNRNYLTFNGSGSGYSERMLYGDGSSAASAARSGSEIQYIYSDSSNETASTFASNEIYIPNYAGSTNKSVSMDGVYENNATGALANINAGLWSNTAAITSVKLTPQSGSSYAQYTTAYLYGITKA